jgi:hypothetical protein
VKIGAQFSHRFGPTFFKPDTARASVESTMILLQAAQSLFPLALESQFEPQLLLALLVALVILGLLVIGGFAAWSKARRLTRGEHEWQDQEWKDDMMRKISESSQERGHTHPPRDRA